MKSEGKRCLYCGILSGRKSLDEELGCLIILLTFKHAGPILKLNLDHIHKYICECVYSTVPLRVISMFVVGISIHSLTYTNLQLDWKNVACNTKEEHNSN